ncbi:hypothetical protein Tco_1083386, partial [Tanacetum coccineum]
MDNPVRNSSQIDLEDQKVVELPNCSWDDIRGLKNVKRELRELEKAEEGLKDKGKMIRYMQARKTIVLVMVYLL